MGVTRTTVVRPNPGGGLVTGVGSGSVARAGVDQDPDAAGGGNTFEELLLSLDVSHYWLMDEASGDYIDSGADGGLDLSLQAAVNAWRQAPLLGPRGTPLNFALWKYNNALPRPRNLGGPVTAGWTTGGMGCWFRVMEIEPGPMSLMSCTWLNNTGLVMQISVEANGALRFECDGSPEVISITTAGSFVTPGVLYYVHIDQAADGNGLIMYVDGVDQGLVTVFSGTGATIDTFAEDAMSGFADPTHTQFGGVASAGFDGTWIGIVGGGYINRNVVFGPANVAALFAAAGNLSGASSDYHETVSDLGWLDESLVIWGTGLHVGASNHGSDGGLGPNQPQASSFDVAPSVENAADNAGVGLQIESGYNRQKQVYGTNNPTFFATAGETNWEPTAGRTAGTVCALVTVNGVGDGDRKIIFTFGTNQGNSFELGVIGTAIGWELFFRAQTTASGVVYEVVSDIIAIGGGPDFGMISVVQDGLGGGPLIYWQDTDRTGIPAVTTTPDVWTPTFGDASGSRWGGEQGSASVDNWEPGELHDMIGYIKALTPAEIASVWDAANGVF